MNTIKTILFIALFSVSSFSFADGNARKEAEALLNIMGMEKALQQTIEQMLTLQMQQNPTLAPFKQVMLKFFNKHMSYESLKEDMATIYAEAFTEQELKELNAFYRTPTGQKTIQKMPELMQKGGQLGVKRVQDNMSELQQMIQEESQRLQSMQEQE